MPRRSVKVKASCPEKNALLSRLLREISDLFVLSVDGDAIVVPCRYIGEGGAKLLLSVFLYTRVSGLKELVLGVDPGESSTGIVAILEGYIVYKDVVHGRRELADAILELSKLVEKMEVYIGASPSARPILEELGRHGVKAVTVPESVHGGGVEHLGWRRVPRHVRDALKIALAGLYMKSAGET